MENKSGFYHEGVVIRRRGYDPGIDIELIDVEFTENLGKICAQYGLNPNRPPLYSLNDDKDGAEDWNKRKLLCTVAAKHVAEQYSDGHLTVFDLFHHYYSLRSEIFYRNEEFFGRPSLDDFEDVAEAIAHHAVYKDFFCITDSNVIVAMLILILIIGPIMQKNRFYSNKICLQ